MQGCINQEVYSLETEALGLTEKVQTQGVVVGFNTWCTKQNRDVESKTNGLNDISPTEFVRERRRKFSKVNPHLYTSCSTFMSKTTTTRAPAPPPRRRQSWSKSRNNIIILLLSTSFILISHQFFSKVNQLWKLRH